MTSPLALFLIFLLFKALVSADLIASSQIESCYDTTDSNSSTSLNCNQMFVITISLDNNELQGSNSIMAYLTSTTNNNNSDITYYLKTPIQIEMSKSQVYAMYPLTYVQDFNNKPMEDVISSSLIDCQDGDYDTNPTCGWQYDSNNQTILYSQGYCCECSFLSVIGLDNSQLSRGNMCEAFNIGEGSASAHCLHMDDLWYSGFNIGTEQIYYSIAITINFLSSNGTNSTAGTPYYSSSIRLGSFNDVGYDQNKTVLAKIIGDFYPLNPPPDLSNYYLMKPSTPVTDPRVMQGMSRWMFISQDGVTLDGTECDKIGVSYEAFQNQANKCNMMIGSCLTNQLEDFDAADLQRITLGETPLYLLSSQGNFLASQNEDQITLLLEITGSFATMLTLQISADDIEYITNLGIGEIDYANISNFEAFSNNGILNMMFTNTGELTAEFDLYFNCDSGINPISFQKFFLNSFQSKILAINVATSNATNQNHSCEIVLEDAVGDTLDTKIVNFTTTEINYTSPQNNSNNDAGNAITQPVLTDVNCANLCPNFYDITCSVENSCSGNLWKFFLFTSCLSIFSFGCCYCCKRHPHLCFSLISWIFKKRDSADDNKDNKKPKKSQNRKKRAQSCISSLSGDDSYYYNDYETNKRKIYSNDFRKSKDNQNAKKFLKKPKHQNNFPLQNKKPEIYCYDQENRSFFLNDAFSQEISDFDTKRELNSKSEIFDNFEFPASLFNQNDIRKYFININHRNNCWREYDFPFDFSVQIFLLVPKMSRRIEDSKVFLPKDSELKYLVHCLYENQTDMIISEILRISLGNIIFLTKHPIYNILSKEDIDRAD